MNSSSLQNYLLGFVGAILGGVLGYFLFTLLAGQGFYALAMPGALVGLGAGLAMRKRSMLMGILCGVGATSLCLFCEWKLFPFTKDPSLSYFLMHLYQLKMLTWAMIIIGALCAGWFGSGRDRFSRPVKNKPEFE